MGSNMIWNVRLGADSARKSLATVFESLHSIFDASVWSIAFQRRDGLGRLLRVFRVPRMGSKTVSIEVAQG